MDTADHYQEHTAGEQLPTTYEPCLDRYQLAAQIFNDQHRRQQRQELRTIN